ncbi:MAG: 23S rRNA (adenine(2503)-C(2))-methyltransferase RlmN [Chloroflexota bacterium]
MHEFKGQDGTIKAIFSLSDGRTVEAALMSYPAGNGRARYTVCVSTQVGCVIGCPFCATGQQGFERNLSPGEIIDQVLYFARRLREPDEPAEDIADGSNITNLVFMGMGEPLANYPALWAAVETLNSPQGFGLGARHITISTAGLVPGIERLGREKLQVGLAISLHAGENRLRNRLVPLNRRYPLEVLLAACREYVARTGRRPSFEYVLFAGINDSLSQARFLADLLRGLNCHVNLIPANRTAGGDFRPSRRQDVLAFQAELERQHIPSTIRQKRGLEIDAGCGQLRSRLMSHPEAPPS